MSHAEDLLTTIETIVRSPLLDGYNVGITVDSKRRKAQYKNWDPTWPHFLIIQKGLSAGAALSIERELQDLIKKNKKLALYRKYRSDTRRKPHTPSLGGLAQDNDRSYDLYICWCNVGDN